MTGVRYPATYSKFISMIDLVNVNMGYILSMACILDTDFHDRLLFATIGPIVVMAALAGLYAIARRRNIHSAGSMSEINRKFASVLLFVLFFVYSSVSHTIFQTFVSHKLDNGITYLQADYRVHFNSSRHQSFIYYAGFMAIVYPIGIPASFAWMLYRYRDVLTMRSQEDDVSEVVQTCRDLWEPYKPRRYYYEIIEYVRRVSLTGISAFIYPTSAAQVAIVFMMAVFFALLFEAQSPFSKPLDAWLYRSGNCLVLLSMYLALLLRVDLSQEDDRSQESFSVVLVILHVGLVCVAVLQPLLWPKRDPPVIILDAPRKTSFSVASSMPRERLNGMVSGGV